MSIMNFIIHCTLVGIAFEVIGINGYAIVETNNVTLGIRIAYNRNTPPCTKSGAFCTEDCTTLLLCSSFQDDPLSQTKCAPPNQYCVNGACTSKLGTSACKASGGAAGSNFRCTDDGVFPDPTDCTKYHICAKGTATTTYQCLPGSVFNAQLKGCQVGRTPCTKIQCSKEKDLYTFTSYTSHPSYYAFCTKDDKGAFEILMFKCPHEQFEVFDSKANACKFKCSAKGNFQNPAECGEYYYCSGVNAQPILGACPANWVFDGTGCNKDIAECKYNTKKPDGALSSADDVTNDNDVQVLFDKVKSNIRTFANLQATADLVPNKFKKKPVSGGGTDYFISFSVDDQGQKSYYHVHIFKESSVKETVKNVITVADEAEEILDTKFP